MPTAKELLDATVKSASAMFKRSAEITKIERSVKRSEESERAIQSRNISGETEPSDET